MKSCKDLCRIEQYFDSPHGGGKKNLHLKLHISEMRSWPRFLRLPPLCGLVSTQRRPEKVYSRFMKDMFPLFTFKRSKIISHFKKKKKKGYFLYTTFFFEYLCIMQSTPCF